MPLYWPRLTRNGTDDSVFRKTASCLCLVLSGWVTSVAAQPGTDTSTLMCLSPEAAQAASQSGVPPQLVISADRANLPDGGISLLEGNVEIRALDRILRAESAQYNPITQRVRIEGTVEYAEDGLSVQGGGADFDAAEQRVQFSDARFVLSNVPARGGAAEMDIAADGSIQLADVIYTTCPEGDDSWQLRASSIHIDTESGFATGRNVRLEFLGVPVFYTPWITFPITDQRKSGFLFPQLRISSRTGQDFSFPYYLNLAPNYDATLTPRLLTERGFMLSGEFRYLTQNSGGTIELDWLPNDRRADQDRYFASLQHQSLLGHRWRFALDATQVSDSSYFEDFSGGATTSQTHLIQRMELEFAGDRLQMLARVQGFQILDDTLAPTDQPYWQMPQIQLTGQWPQNWLGLDFALRSELTRFERSAGVTGWRANVLPSISRTFGFAGFYVRPTLALQHTEYYLDAGAPQRRLSRTLPIYSLDVGTQLQRYWAGGRLLQTLEPRIQYLHVPYRDQSALPVFDTIEPDFGLMQLFQFNRYLGPDRVQNADQITLGLTTRFTNPVSGQELLSLTLGQAYQLSDQRVALPGANPLTRGSAEYVGELQLRLADAWSFDLAYHWHGALSTTARMDAGIRYRPDDERLLQLSYRYRRDSMEQIDAIVAWPIAQQWNVVARYNYSLRDQMPLDRFLGLEYEACCFTISLAMRRQIVRRTGEADTSFALQIQLRGLGSVGEAPSDFLERGIIGYDR